MRRWLILGAALLAASALGMLYTVARLNDYLATHRDEIAEWASQALGRPVTFEAIRVSLRRGGSVRLTGLRIADDPRFGRDAFLQAASAVAAISLLDAARGALGVRAVVVDAPTLHLSRDAAGWNVDSLAPLQPQPEAAPNAAPEPVAGPAPAETATAPPVHVRWLSLRHGVVTVTDRRRQPPATATIDQVDLTVSQPNPGAPLAIDAKAALFGAATPNASIHGRLTPGAPSTADVQVEWESIPLAALRAVVPAVGDYDVSGESHGDLRFAGSLAAVGTGDVAALLPALSGTVDVRAVDLALRAAPARITGLAGALHVAPDAVELTDVTARIGEAPVAGGCRMAPPTGAVAQCRFTCPTLDLRPLGVGDGEVRGLSVDATLSPFAPVPTARANLQAADGRLGTATFGQLEIAASVQGDTAEVARASLAAFGGTVRANGRCTAVTGPAPACSSELALQDTQTAAILAALRSGAAQRVDGRLDADLRLSTAGRDAAALRRSARGDASVRVSDGVVKDLNLAQRVLGVIPGIDAATRSGSRAAALLGSSDTRFQRLSATLRIADERVRSDDLALEAEDFSVRASGSAGFAGDLSLRGTFRGSAPLVGDLAGGIPVLGQLAARTKGIIAIPFTVSGTAADPRVEPDLGSIASGLGHEATAGLEALFGAPKRGTSGGVLRQDLDKLFGR